MCVFVYVLWGYVVCVLCVCCFDRPIYSGRQSSVHLSVCAPMWADQSGLVLLVTQEEVQFSHTGVIFLYRFTVCVCFFFSCSRG